VNVCRFRWVEFSFEYEGLEEVIAGLTVGRKKLYSDKRVMDF